MVGALDYLFIDEAGQVSVANLVAMSRAAKNIILIGDQMQLEQPIQASHPKGSGQSTLGVFPRRGQTNHSPEPWYFSGYDLADASGCLPLCIAVILRRKIDGETGKYKSKIDSFRAGSSVPKN